MGGRICSWIRGGWNTTALVVISKKYFPETRNNPVYKSLQPGEESLRHGTQMGRRSGIYPGQVRRCQQNCEFFLFHRRIFLCFTGKSLLPSSGDPSTSPGRRGTEQHARNGECRLLATGIRLLPDWRLPGNSFWRWVAFSSLSKEQKILICSLGEIRLWTLVAAPLKFAEKCQFLMTPPWWIDREWRGEVASGKLREIALFLTGKTKRETNKRGMMKTSRDCNEGDRNRNGKDE